jgi:hypothetical protein
MTTATTEPSPRISSPTRADLPLWRLYLLRLGYLIMGGGLVVYKWPQLVTHDNPWPVMDSVVTCMLVGMSLLALVGLRYPVRMLPILLFEVTWKLIWLAAVALPAAMKDRMDPDTWASTTEILWVIVIMAVIPWPYIWSNLLARRGDRWRRIQSSQIR